MLNAMIAANFSRRQCLVLLVEDSAETYELYSEVLAKAGYAVVGADNGEEAYQQAVVARARSGDHGLRAARPRKQHDGCAAMDTAQTGSAHGGHSDRHDHRHVSAHEFERARAAGCDAFLAKPVSYEQLLDEVSGACTHERCGSVLLVEDDEDIRASVGEILRDEGFEVIAATDGNDALRLLRGADELPRLILLDLMMPVMDGWAFRDRRSSPTSGWRRFPSSSCRRPPTCGATLPSCASTTTSSSRSTCRCCSTRRAARLSH